MTAPTDPARVARELNRMKVLFQRRAIVAALGLPVTPTPDAPLTSTPEIDHA